MILCQTNNNLDSCGFCLGIRFYSSMTCLSIEKGFLLESRLKNDIRHSSKDSVVPRLGETVGNLELVSKEGSEVGFMEGMKFH